MSTAPSRASAASRVFLVVLLAVLLLSSALFALLVVIGRQNASESASAVTQAVSTTLADLGTMPETVTSADAATILQPVAERVVADTEVDFIVFMTPDGTRLTHPDPDRIGESYSGVIPAEAVSHTGNYVGHLGESLRTIVPIRADGEVVGWVSTGITLRSIFQEALEQLPVSVIAFVVMLVVGFLAALLIRRLIWRLAGDLPASEIRNTITARESIRTLSEALRAQTHEFSNRMHTVLGLLELDRRSEAVALLTQTDRRSQLLLDLVDAHDRVDPAIVSLLLGKASQARERGVEVTVEIAPDTPRSVLEPVECVAVVGNILDNALDAAAAGAEPRWVEVALHPTDNGDLAIVVMDSGPGIPTRLRERVLEPGFSTKPAGAAGRGVGLPLAVDVLEGVGGRLEFHPELPMTVTVTIPATIPAERGRA